MKTMKAKQKSNYIQRMFLSLLVAAMFLASIAPIASADPGWNCRRAINISNSGGRSNQSMRR